MRWERIWYPRDPLGKALSLALTPLGWIYAASWQVYLLAYRYGMKRPSTPPIPTICVGNLEVGGSGKTPVAIALVKLLQELGFKPALSLSGYGSPASKGASILLPGESVHAAKYGDETALARTKLPNVPLIVGRERTRAAKLAPTTEANVLVLDDGFQHLPLARSLDFIVWQPERQSQRCLPAGPLREPEQNVKRAGAILLPNGATPPPYKLPYFLFERTFGPLRSLTSGELVPIHDAPTKVVALSAIARPDRFRQTLETLGFCIEEEMRFPDHSTLTQARLDESKTYICTEKDAVKLIAKDNVKRVFALESDVVFLDPQAIAAFVQPYLEKNDK